VLVTLAAWLPARRAVKSIELRASGQLDLVSDGEKRLISCSASAPCRTDGSVAHAAGKLKKRQYKAHSNIDKEGNHPVDSQFNSRLAAQRGCTFGESSVISSFWLERTSFHS